MVFVRVQKPATFSKKDTDPLSPDANTELSAYDARKHGQDDLIGMNKKS